MRLVLATKNEGKRRELELLLAPLGYEVLSQLDLGIVDQPQETGETFEQNAYLKAKAVFDCCGEVTLADDSGLMVDALAGAPGVHTARYAGEHATDQQNIDRLLCALERETNRSARFVCVLCCIREDGEAAYFRGECPGEIEMIRHGSGGFGYDPVFLIPQRGKTFGEMSEQEKEQISHRGKALRCFCAQADAFLQGGDKTHANQ